MNEIIPLFSSSFLMACWAQSYCDYCASSADATLLLRLQQWAEKDFQQEIGAEGAFIQRFFVELWGYQRSGEQDQKLGYTLVQQFAIDKAGQNGGVGKADAAMGWFGVSNLPAAPQILCEFKDIRSGLDSKQNRKGNNRSPIKQCADYLHFAKLQFTPFGEKIEPTWGIVTDMNEFRLYWNARMPQQYQRFVIKNKTLLDTGIDLLGKSETARQQRFLFSRLFHVDWLLNRGHDAPLLALIKQQRIQEKSLEKTFYFEYRAYRDLLFKTLLKTNPSYQAKPRQLVRLTQKLLDRLLFILFCEDMGAHLQFPVNLLRDILINDSQDSQLLPDANDIWEEKILRLFKAMRQGGEFRTKTINKFNGGLFAADPELDDLNVPNCMFFAPNQGFSENLLKYKDTLLYFSAHYNFGIEEGGERAIGLYTLGRIFEQSITDLEILEAESANEESLMKLGKRKTDGVYYTPEWVTAYIVEETLGLRLREMKAAMGEQPFTELDQKSIDNDHYQKGTLKKKSLSADYFNWLENYEKQLSSIKVLDPACGSGAFLIQALKRLLQEHEWIASEKSRVNYEYRQVAVFDRAKTYRAILAKNLYGVDVNAESVEITKLALWLHTVMPNQPLSSLDTNILCGNSLVDWDINTTEKPLSEWQLERINPFSYREAFADVFEAGGFDVIIGNPPYIKLQNMRRIQTEATDYWVTAKNTDKSPKFRSTQTGNYDIYLPFIEQSISLLKSEGRMGFIAPNVWAVNDYGQGLREMLHETKHMDRWVDFKSYQIFEEAITYTALQFFTGTAVEGIKLHFAPNGGDDLAHIDWSQIPTLPYSELPTSAAWQFMPNEELKLIQKLNKSCKRLDDQTVTNSIFQGLKTGGDDFFIGYRINNNEFQFNINKNQVIHRNIEKGIMMPVVSGSEAKRYQKPKTENFIIFPYNIKDSDKGKLLGPDEIIQCYPLTWSYLSERESYLKLRENGKLDFDNWYQFSRNQGIKQMGLPKILVAGTAPELRVSIDDSGDFAFMGGRVCGILPTNASELNFLTGLLNSPVLSFVFKRIARPKSGGYFDAETQFLAPLPIPNATDEQKKQVGDLAKTLQTLHTAYRDELHKLEKRLNAAQMVDSAKTPQWIWGEDFLDEKQWKFSEAAKQSALKGKALSEWAKKQYKNTLAQKLEKLTLNLNANTILSVHYNDGELSLRANGIQAFDSVFEDHAELIAVQWKYVIRTTNITPSVTAEKLLEQFLQLKTTSNVSLHKQIVAIDEKLDELQCNINDQEAQMNTLVYGLYNLTPADVSQIERG